MQSGCSPSEITVLTSETCRTRCEFGAASHHQKPRGRGCYFTLLPRSLTILYAFGFSDKNSFSCILSTSRCDGGHFRNSAAKSRISLLLQNFAQVKVEAEQLKFISKQFWTTQSWKHATRIYRLEASTLSYVFSLSVVGVYPLSSEQGIINQSSILMSPIVSYCL